MGAIGCWRCSRLMDEQSFHPPQATGAHHRLESRHDLRFSGSCSDQHRSLRLERIGYAYRRVAIAPFGPLPRKRERAFFDSWTAPVLNTNRVVKVNLISV